MTYKLRKDDSEHTLDADVVLVATGRKPFTEGLGLDALGVTMTKRGQIAVERPLADQCARHLRHRRRDRRPDAGP